MTERSEKVNRGEVFPNAMGVREPHATDSWHRWEDRRPSFDPSSEQRQGERQNVLLPEERVSMCGTRPTCRMVVLDHPSAADYR